MPSRAAKEMPHTSSLGMCIPLHPPLLIHDYLWNPAATAPHGVFPRTHMQACHRVAMTLALHTAKQQAIASGRLHPFQARSKQQLHLAGTITSARAALPREGQDDLVLGSGGS